MAQGTRANVRMQFNDGTAFDEWLSLDLRDTWTDPLGDLRFEAAPGRERVTLYRDKLQKGELVTVFVNGVNQGGFLIQTVSTRVSAKSGVTFSVACHTPLITPYQGGVTPKLSIKGKSEVPVSEAVLKALGPYGFDRLVGDAIGSASAVTGKPINGGRAPLTVTALKQDQMSAQASETAYQFGSRIVTRLGACLKSTPEGYVLVCAPDYDQDPIATLVLSADPQVSGDRFIDEVEIVDTNDNQFSECTVDGVQSDKAGRTETAKPTATVRASDLFPNRPAYKSIGTQDAPSPAGYKPLFITDKNAMSIDRCASTAKLALGIRAKDAFVISGAVAGFQSTTGAIWTAGTVVDVVIDPLGFREPMFILERTFSRTREAGDVTKLRLIPLGALVLGDAPGSG